MFDSSYLNSGIIKRYSTGRNTYFSMAGVNFSQVMEKKMNKIFSVLLLVTLSFGIISCSEEDPSGTTSQLSQVLDQPNSTDDRNNIDIPVIIFDSCNSIDSSTIDNSTVIRSSISDNSSIKDSTVKDCSAVVRSIVDNSSTIDNSTIINLSTINRSFICAQSRINNSTIDNSTVCDNSTVQGGSIVRNSSSVCYATIDNATIDNSTVCVDNGSVTMSIANRIVLDRTMTESDAPTLDPTNPFFPANNDNNSSCTDNITVTFSEDMDNNTVTTNTDNGSCYGTIQVSLSTDNFATDTCVRMTSGNPSTSDNTTFGVKPAPTKLTASSTYKIRVTTGVTDPSGNPMSDNNTTGTGFTTAVSKSNGC